MQTEISRGREATQHSQEYGRWFYSFFQEAGEGIFPNSFFEAILPLIHNRQGQFRKRKLQINISWTYSYTLSTAHWVEDSQGLLWFATVSQQRWTKAESSSNPSSGPESWCSVWNVTFRRVWGSPDVINGQSQKSRVKSGPTSSRWHQNETLQPGGIALGWCRKCGWLIRAWN